MISLRIIHRRMRNKSITTLYLSEIQKFIVNKTATWNDDVVLKIEDRLQCHISFNYIRPVEAFCTCGSILQGITAGNKKQPEKRINSRFIMYIPRVHNFALKNIQRGRRYGNSADSHTLKKARAYLGSARKLKLRNKRGALLRGREVPNANARTRILAIRHGTFNRMAIETWTYVAPSHEKAYDRSLYKVV